MLKAQYLPSIWKKAKIIMLPKLGKNPSIPTNYRPISLLPALEKLFEKIIYQRILQITNEKEIIPPEQFGFRAEHSTVQKVLRITETYYEDMRHGKYTAAIFLDVSKAFDRVWHQGLIYKMHKYQYPTDALKLLTSYLTDRTFQVYENASTSSERK